MEKQSALEVICEAVKLNSDLDTVSSSTRFYGDGIDSLEVVEIVMVCEKEFRVNIPDTVTYDPDLTIGSLADLIEAELARRV